MMVFHPAFHLSSYILPIDSQERLRSNRPLNRTCELVGDFIASHSGMGNGKVVFDSKQVHEIFRFSLV